MKRTGFKPRAQHREPRDPDRVRSTPTVSAGAWRTPRAVDAAPTEQIAKTAPVRSEALRRAVASLPCAICGVYGYSQAAHGSEGKGAGIKACDLTLFPACCDRPGVRGCHGRIDQGALFTKAVRRELEPVWAADTRRKLVALGLWPKGVPVPD
ncbi:hypothetical protein [Acidovorax sp. BL-A-41-H1]|uniref:hypothetical protein n=1 Tax=Acidovorax sp. BL-A-41-H1 TaxID=3421102 RepID=UPI003F7A27BE